MGKQINGPWTFEDSAHIYDADAYPIAVMLMDAPRNNMQANAALISAAPDLLQALEGALKLINKAWEYDGDIFGIMHNEATDITSMIEEAIARARGQ